MSIEEMIFDRLEAQRIVFLSAIDGGYANKFVNKETCKKYYTTMVFSEDDILEQSIKGFCRLEDVICLNEIRDYQNETIDLCVNKQN